MKTQKTHGKHTEDGNINNIKPKTKPHTKTLNQNKITVSNNILWTTNLLKTTSKTTQIFRIQLTKTELQHHTSHIQPIKNATENTTNCKDNAQQKECTQQPNTKPTKTSTEESHIIPETQSLPKPISVPETYPIPTTQEQDEFLASPSQVTSNRFQPLQNNPDPQNTTTPEKSTKIEKDNENDQQHPRPKTKTQLRREYKTYKAKKLTTQLQAKSFRDIGNLSNATNDEKVKIIALSMYNRLGVYDPSNEFIRNYKNKNILEKYKNISEERPTQLNTLLELYDIIQTIDTRID